MAIDPSIALGYRPPQINIDVPSPIHQMGQVLTLRGLMEQSQARQLEMQQTQQAIQQGALNLQVAQREADRNAKDAAIYQQSYHDANGNLDDTQKLMIQRGASPQILFNLRKQQLEERKSLSEIGKNELATHEYENEQLLNLTDQAKALSADQLAAQWPAFRQSAIAIRPSLAAHLPDQAPSQQDLAAYSLQFNTRKGQIAAAKDLQQTAQSKAETDLATAKTPGEKAKSDIEAANARALTSMTDVDWQNALNATVPDNTSPLYKRTAAQVQFYRSKGDMKGAADAIKQAGEQLGKTETAVATAKATEPIKVNIAAATAGARAAAVADAAGLTDDDYQRAGEQYARTGVMPAVGRDSITRAKIVKFGNQWARDNGLNPGDVVAMQAAYAGDKDSLKKFQSQRDQIVSFEQTAQKNLDLFLNAASKIPDTGVPWLNRPLRELSSALVGSENMAAVNAARNVANNEIAKVTSGGGLSGVLSDAARREVAEYNPANATFAQTKAVANVLKQDMANRHQSMDATLDDIKSRIGGKAPQSAAPATWSRTGTDAKTGHKLGWNPGDQFWTDTVTGKPVK